MHGLSDDDGEFEARIEAQIEQTRKALYASKTDTQIIMLALCDILKRVEGAPVIIRELFSRYKGDDDAQSK